MGWFLLGVSLGMILGIFLYVTGLVYIYKEDPDTFDNMIDKLKKRAVKVNQKKNS